MPRFSLLPIYLGTVALLLALGLNSRADAPESGVQITPTDSVSLQHAIEDAWHQGHHRVVVTPGTYRLDSPGPPGSCLSFSRLTDFEIDATGVTFIFTDRTRGSIQFSNCKNVTLLGATLLRDPMPFSQGTITSVAADGKSLDVKVSAGYPADFDDPRFYPKIWLNSYNAATRQWQADLFAGPASALERLGPDSFRYHPGRPLGPHSFFVAGSAVAWRGFGNGDIGISACEGMKILDVTIKSGIGFCVHENGGEGGNFYRYTVTYGPKPAGATEEPLLSSNADSFHSDSVRKGPTLEDCHFEGMNDDGIPIHGEYALALQADGNDIIAAIRYPTFGLPGDSLRLMDERGALAGEAKVLAFEPLKDYEPVNPPKGYRIFDDLTKAHFVKITLDQKIAAKPGWLIANANANGDGFVVRRCTIRNNRARGMLIKASDGLIEDCVLEGNSMSGIAVSPEMTYWNESDFARHLIIRHNILRRTGYWTEPGFGQAGALTVAAWEHGHYVPLPGGHRNIDIEDNTFENDDGPNIIVSSAQDVVIRNNHFVHPMETSNTKGRATGIAPDALIWLTESSGVQLLDNLVTSPGPFLKQLVVATPTVTGSGFQQGISVSK